PQSCDRCDRVALRGSCARSRHCPGHRSVQQILIFPSKGPTGFFALVQLAEGGAPFVVLVPVRVAGTQVEFTMPASGPYGGLNFTGTVTRTELIGKWSSGSAFAGAGDRERLKRGKSYWQ